ncbi:MAG TPA: TaqI-like C-terminal specificity domain-containing protein [bacterium]|nr:TaqI-like C-terminal specificity domain-containing protein [bacterium]
MPRFYRIYEKNSDNNITKYEKENTIYDIIHNEKTGCFQVGQTIYVANSGHFHISTKSKEPWKLVTKNENDFIETITNNSNKTIADVAKVRVGIKTNADTVFIRNDWDELPPEIRPERELLKPILSSYESNKWLSKSNKLNKRYVLYTHINKNGKRTPIELSNFPKAKKYLEQYREKLEERTYLIQANRQWYEIWVPQNPNAWKEPKIIFPDISPEPKFFFDNNNSIVDGNCYWITINDKYDENLLFLILGLSNSEVLTKFHDLCFNNKLYSGRRRYFTQYVAKYPLPDISKNECKEIIKLVKELINNNADKIKTENRINALAYKVYGI